MTKLNELKRLLNHCENAIKTAEDSGNPTDIPWEIAYKEIFNVDVSTVMFRLYQEVTGHRLNYYDPDASYEEDVRAFVTSFADAIWEIEHPVE